MSSDSHSTDPLPRIPVPLSIYWREVRQRILPVIVFVVVVVAVFFFWDSTAVNSGVPGIGEGVRSLISSQSQPYKEGDRRQDLAENKMIPN